MEIDRCENREIQRLDSRAGEELIGALCAGRLVLAFQPILQFNYLDTPCLYNEVLLRQAYGPMTSINVQSCADAIGALELGMVTAGVTTGVTTQDEFATVERPPHLICSGLPELLTLLQEADAQG